MISRFVDLLKLPSVMLETGLTMAQTTLETAQRALETLTGQDQGPLKGAPRTW